MAWKRSQVSDSTAACPDSAVDAPTRPRASHIPARMLQQDPLTERREKNVLRGTGSAIRTPDPVSPFEYIKSDLYRYAGTTSLTAMLKHLTFNRSFKYSFWLRLRRARFAPLRFIAAVMHRHLRFKYGVRIHADCEIGFGLYIGHPMGILVNHTARIGNNCNISQFTTIGSNFEQAAVIGDNVYIGPSVCIVEDVRVGNDATIGAGAIVVKNVPAGATVAGNPARVISMSEPGRFVVNRWPPRNRRA